jgi:hypothetical protein
MRNVAFCQTSCIKAQRLLEKMSYKQFLIF